MSSRIASLYGDRIEERVRRTLAALGIADVAADVEEHGALDWVISARVEAAARHLRPDLRAEDLPPAASTPAPTERQRLRRSRLYLPGNNPTLMLNADLFGADGIILDLEDAVHPDEKEASRILVRNALRALDFGRSERMVRVNPLPVGLDEIAMLVPHGVDIFLLPKAENPHDIGQAGAFLDSLAPDRPPFLMPIIESALGVMKAFEIASSSPRVVALAFGAEDYTRDVGAERTNDGVETLWARCRIVAAARAAGVQPIDTVFSDVNDPEGLISSAREARALGFEGKGCIHPSQIAPVNEAWNPTEEEIRHALAVDGAMRRAESEGRSVAALGSKMIDPPVAARARRILATARAAGIPVPESEEAGDE